MKPRVLLALAALLMIAGVAHAQTTIVNPATEGFAQWTQPTTGTQPDRFEVAYDGGAFATIGLPAPAAGVYRTKLSPTLPDGSHTIAFKACHSTSAPQCSAATAPVSFVFDRPEEPPATPTELQIILTVPIAANGVLQLQQIVIAGTVTPRP